MTAPGDEEAKGTAEAGAPSPEGAGTVIPRTAGRPLLKRLGHALNKLAEKVLKKLFVNPFWVAHELGIGLTDLLLSYAFLVVVVAVPLAALFLKRGVSASLQDGEAFLFSLGLTLAVLYEHGKSAVEAAKRPLDFLGEFFKVETFIFVLLNLGALGVSMFFIVTSGDSGHAHDLYDGRFWWFCGVVFVGVVMPLSAFIDWDGIVGDAAGTTSEGER